MAKRWTKQKAGKQKGKKRKKGPTGSGDTGAAGGTMGGFRRGLKWFTGGGDKAQSTRDRIVNALLWVAVAVAGAFFFYKKCA